MREELLEIIRKESLQFGEFILASGKKSNYYIDIRKTSLHPKGLKLISHLIYSMIKDLEIDSIGGPTIGADPIVAGVTMLSADTKKPIGGFLIRKDKKLHGTGKKIEGCFYKGIKVVIVEDVVTSGGSTLNAIRSVEEEGGKVEIVIAVVDRMQGGKENIEREGYRFFSLFTSDEILGNSLSTK
ncbi:MAG: orotate phosphoribosyltransferase [Candidatus Schekmanbacteria bacterium]|nr:MAG: orotate phosphoribosyltransferase [Candidatus Schekmanbacteria bacterium]